MRDKQWRRSMRISKGHYVPIRTVHYGTDLRKIAKEAGVQCRKIYGKIPFCRKPLANKSDGQISDTESEVSETWSETRRNMLKFET